MHTHQINKITEAFYACSIQYISTIPRLLEVFLLFAFTQRLISPKGNDLIHITILRHTPTFHLAVILI